MPNISLGQPAARGRTADVYNWEDGYVLKLFHPWVEPGDIQYEAEITRLVQASGLPVPRVGEIVQVGRRSGLIYERVNGPSMMEAVMRKPWRLSSYADRFAELQAQMHSQELEITLPSQRQKLENKIRRAGALPAEVQAALLSILTELPGGSRLCHGDFHPGNILLAERGEVIIDWVDSALGNPLADLARTAVLLQGAASKQIPNPGMRLITRLFQAASLSHYFRLRPGGEAEYRRWLPVAAGARLSEGIPEPESWLAAQSLVQPQK